jgi:predicted ATP-grasp superfamily ATP-dependent carboligase
VHAVSTGIKEAMKNFLVIGASKPLVVQLLLAIHAFTDAKCIVMCARGTRFMRWSSLCSKFLEADFNGADDQLLVESANHLFKSLPDLVLIAADCAGARLINRVRDRISVHIAATPDSAMLDRLDDKWQFYLLCKSLGLRVPETRFIDNKFELDFALIARELGVPLIVKPVNEYASRGAYVISSESEYRKEIRDNPDYRYAPLIAQRFIAGQDVGLNVHGSHGKVTAIAIQKRIDPNHDGSRIEFFYNQYLLDVAHILVDAAAYNGVMNIDARIHEETGEIYLFESNPRYWRSLSASVWCGLNFAAECLEPPRMIGDLRILDAGSADTYYHPFFQLALWKYALLDQGHRGRLARIMMCDISLLFTSTRIQWQRCQATVCRYLRSSHSRLIGTRNISSADKSKNPPPGEI